MAQKQCLRATLVIYPLGLSKKSYEQLSEETKDHFKSIDVARTKRELKHAEKHIENPILHAAYDFEDWKQKHEDFGPYWGWDPNLRQRVWIYPEIH